MTEPTKQQMLACLDKLIFSRGTEKDALATHPHMRRHEKLNAMTALDLDIAVLNRCKAIVGETMPEVVEAHHCPACSDINAKERHLESLRDVGQEAVQRSS